MVEYLSIGGLTLFLVGSVYALNREITKRPTFTDTDKRYKKTEVCDEIHKSVNEKLSCLPDMKKSLTQIETKIDIIIKNNGK